MTASDRQSCEVLVVGAGPVGMTVAALLGQLGIDTKVLEQSDDICHHPRAQSIDDESLRTLQALGIAEMFKATLEPALGSRYYDDDNHCFAEIGAGPENFGHPKRSFMLQQDLERVLLARLRELNCVEVVFNRQVTGLSQQDGGVQVQTAGGEHYQCQYLLACDGGQSGIRTALGIAMQGNTYERDWIVLDTDDDPDTERYSRFICNTTRPHVSVASPNGARRYEFMLLDGETREEVLSDEFISQLLAPYRSINAAQISRRAVYRFHARMAEQLRQQRVLLLGDAAHLSPPFAGQGMNAGIRDAHNVAWKLAGVLRHNFHPDILDSYEAERREPIWAMIQLAVAMGEFVMPMGDEQQALTQSLMLALERFPGAGDWIFQMKFKPRPRYTAGLFVDLQQQAFEASLVGEMIPQPHVLNTHGQLCLLDEMIGHGYCLLAQDDAGQRCIESLQSDLWRALAPTRLRLRINADDGHAAAGLRTATIAADSTYHRPLRTHRDQILLIRPDRYVVGAFFPSDAAAFEASLRALLYAASSDPAPHGL